MITYIKGDLLSTPDRVIVHGCNAQGVMGSGVAKAIREKYPKAFEDYKRICGNWHHQKYPVPESEYMGFVQSVVQPDGRIICNAITQRNYGKDGNKYVSYDAIDKAMQILGACRNVPVYQNISMPKIGAGLGGGDWGVIEAIIKHRLVGINVSVYYLE